MVPSQGKHVKVIAAQDFMPNLFHFIVGVPLSGCVFVLCVNGNVPKKGIFFVCFDCVEFTFLGNKLDLCVSVEDLFYKTKKRRSRQLNHNVTLFSSITLSIPVCTCS